MIILTNLIHPQGALGPDLQRMVNATYELLMTTFANDIGAQESLTS